MQHYPMMSKVYFALALIGFGWSWFYFFQYFSSAESLLVGPFLQSAMVNSASSGVAIDALIAGVVFSVMALTDAPRDGVRWPWLYVAVCFLIGLCVALPLYLGFRESRRASVPSCRD